MQNTTSTSTEETPKRPRGRPAGITGSAMASGLSLKAKPEEIQAWKAAAAKASEKMSRWIRDTLNAAS